MPISLELVFRIERKPEVLYPADVHGIIFNLFEESVAERVHQLPKKPFVLKGFELEEERLRIDLCLLDDKLYPALLHGYYFPKNHLHIRGSPLKAIKGKGVKEKKSISYQELLQTKPYRKVEMEFLTPMAFNRYKLDYPIPEPNLVFLNLVHRWNEFSEVSLEVKEEEILKNLAVQKLEGSTQEFVIDGRLKRVGFLGKVIFLVKSDELCQKVSTLSLFSNFAGVGMKTAMGMGVVKASLRGPIQR